MVKSRPLVVSLTTKRLSGCELIFCPIAALYFYLVPWFSECEVLLSTTYKVFDMGRRRTSNFELPPLPTARNIFISQGISDIPKREVFEARLHQHEQSGSRNYYIAEIAAAIPFLLPNHNGERRNFISFRHDRPSPLAGTFDDYIWGVSLQSILVMRPGVLALPYWYGSACEG